MSNLSDIDRNLIVESDIKEAIWLSDKSGDKFYNEADELWQCSMVKSALTYWVQYKETAPKTYEIFSAYYHRMRFNKGEDLHAR